MNSGVAKVMFLLFMVGTICVGAGIAVTSMELANLEMTSYIPTSSNLQNYEAIVPLTLSKDDDKMWVTGYGVELKLIEDEDVPVDEVYITGHYPSDIVTVWQRESFSGGLSVVAQVQNSYKLNILQSSLLGLSEGTFSYPALESLVIEVYVYVHPDNVEDVRVQSTPLDSFF